MKRVAILLAALALVALGCGAYVWYQWSRLVITVRNGGPAGAATDIEVSVQGDRAVIPALRPGEQRDLVLAPDDESGIELLYRLGDQSCTWAGGYVEGRGGYRVALDIQGCSEVHDRTWLWP